MAEENRCCKKLCASECPGRPTMVIQDQTRMTCIGNPLEYVINSFDIQQPGNPQRIQEDELAPPQARLGSHEPVPTASVIPLPSIQSSKQFHDIAKRSFVHQNTASLISKAQSSTISFGHPYSTELLPANPKHQGRKSSRKSNSSSRQWFGSKDNSTSAHAGSKASLADGVDDKNRSSKKKKNKKSIGTNGKSKQPDYQRQEERVILEEDFEDDGDNSNFFTEGSQESAPVPPMAGNKVVVPCSCQGSCSPTFIILEPYCLSSAAPQPQAQQPQGRQWGSNNISAQEQPFGTMDAGQQQPRKNWTSSDLDALDGLGKKKLLKPSASDFENETLVKPRTKCKFQSTQVDENNTSLINLNTAFRNRYMHSDLDKAYVYPHINPCAIECTCGRRRRPDEKKVILATDDRLCSCRECGAYKSFGEYDRRTGLDELPAPRVAESVHYPKYQRTFFQSKTFRPSSSSHEMICMCSKQKQEVKEPAKVYCHPQPQTLINEKYPDRNVETCPAYKPTSPSVCSGMKSPRFKCCSKRKTKPKKKKSSCCRRKKKPTTKRVVVDRSCSRSECSNESCEEILTVKEMRRSKICTIL